MRRVPVGLILVALVSASIAGGWAPSLAQEPGGAKVYLPLLLSGAAITGPTEAATPTPTPSRTPAPAGNCTAATGYDQVHLAWIGEPSTTLTIVWRTQDAATQSRVQYRVLGDSSWQVANGGQRQAGTTGKLHETTLAGLAPNTPYEYCVQGDDEAWSTPFTATTAPPPGPADFTAIYVADTGLVGRTDGLATGTQQVIDEIAQFKPNVILGGGDYTYFDSDKRYGTYENSIDEWFKQMQKAIAYAPLMATYGNHEYELDNEPEDGVTPWAQRLPSPPGFNAGIRRNYSFDVGDAHFIALFAATDRAGIPDETKAWFEDDVQKARARGARWIIPYYHVTPFGDGSNHLANLLVREDVGPIFEAAGVQIALASHDQAYERSYPLAGVGYDTYTVTSTELTCYTMGEGTTYVKVSPGGKESNRNGGFAQFASSTKPDWTAVRDNTMHHFARLVFSASGSVVFEAWGVTGDGATPVLVDSFKYTTGTCP